MNNLPDSGSYLVGRVFTKRFSMMLADLRQLLEYLPCIDVGMDDISAAILDQNCLGKQSTSRAITQICRVHLQARVVLPRLRPD